MMRIGIGYDSHRLIEGRKLILGGVEIPCGKGLLGHSDADVLLHAICDAFLGAMGEGDLGRHFPDNDHAYKDIPSGELLTKVNNIAIGKGFEIYNIDTTVVLESPKLRTYVKKIIEKTASILNIDRGRINIKATTNEGMGFIGRGEGIAAFAVILLKETEGAYAE
jgi:2-C-methyl-D-erythritol 2,4-cyclodiphosphate synthase